MIMNQPTQDIQMIEVKKKTRKQKQNLLDTANGNIVLDCQIKQEMVEEPESKRANMLESKEFERIKGIDDLVSWSILQQKLHELQ